MCRVCGQGTGACLLRASPATCPHVLLRHNGRPYGGLSSVGVARPAIVYEEALMAFQQEKLAVRPRRQMSHTIMASLRERIAGSQKHAIACISCPIHDAMNRWTWKHNVQVEASKISLTYVDHHDSSIFPFTVRPPSSNSFFRRRLECKSAMSSDPPTGFPCTNLRVNHWRRA